MLWFVLSEMPGFSNWRDKLCWTSSIPGVIIYTTGDAHETVSNGNHKNSWVTPVRITLAEFWTYTAAIRNEFFKGNGQADIANETSLSTVQKTLVKPTDRSTQKLQRRRTVVTSEMFVCVDSRSLGGLECIEIMDDGSLLTGVMEYRISVLKVFLASAAILEVAIANRSHGHHLLYILWHRQGYWSSLASLGHHWNPAFRTERNLTFILFCYPWNSWSHSKTLTRWRLPSNFIKTERFFLSGVSV